MKESSQMNLDAINILKGLAYSQLEVDVTPCSWRTSGPD
jgi:hypothetical protein